MYPQKLSPFWWTQNIRYFIYFLREFTGVLIAFYAIFFLAQAIFDPTLSFVKNLSFQIISWIGLAAAIFHSITWFWVTVKLLPLSSKKWLRVIAFFLLIGLWLSLSYSLLYFFYE